MNKKELISVAKLTKELKRFEKDLPEAAVTCWIPNGPLCYAINIDKNEDGTVCIVFEEGEEDSGCLNVDMLLEYLAKYDSSTLVCMQACGLYMTFSTSRDGRFFSYDEEEEYVWCDGDIIGEYEEKESGSGWLTEAEKRMLEEEARKENLKSKIEYGALLIITILTLCGVAYNVWAAVTASGDSLWENILYGITCLFCFIIGLLALHYNRR